MACLLVSSIREGRYLSDCDSFHPVVEMGCKPWSKDASSAGWSQTGQESLRPNWAQVREMVCERQNSCGHENCHGWVLDAGGIKSSPVSLEKRDWWVSEYKQPQAGQALIQLLEQCLPGGLLMNALRSDAVQAPPLLPSLSLSNVKRKILLLVAH